MTQFVPKRRQKDSAPFIVIYGGPGEGKTTLANSFPNPVFLRTEVDDNQEQFTIKDGVFETYDEFVAGLQFVKDMIKGDEHIVETVVVDTADYLERLCVQAIENDPDFNDASVWDRKDQQAKLFERVINYLMKLRDNLNVAIVLLAHQKVIRAEDLTTTRPYDRHVMSLSDDRNTSAIKLLQDKADAVFFIKRPVEQDQKTGRCTMSEKPTVYTMPGGAFDAKNRYRKFGMPKKIIALPEDNGFDKIGKHIPWYKDMFENAETKPIKEDN